MRKTEIMSILRASIGLFFCGVGVYATIQSGIGLSPWDVFHFGLVNTFGFKYGTISILTATVVVCINFFLKEQIGPGMILDALIVGKTVDLLNYFSPIPHINNLWYGIILMLFGMIIMGFSQYLYMSAALGCGPRDGLLVALARRVPKVPIGVVGIFLYSSVTLVGWMLGGKFGVGTIMFALMAGPIMQIDFRIVNFHAIKIRHHNIKESFTYIFGKQKSVDMDVDKSGDMDDKDV